MTEADYWANLEYRVCREFAGMPDRRLQYLWCDGFIPYDHLLDDPKPQIVGRVWICNGPQQAEWEFVLLLPRPFGSRDEIDWATLLPADNATRWLTLDESGCRIEIEPGCVVPDLI